MALQNVWIRTLGDGLIRADQVIGIGSRRTPALAGKPGRWLVTAALAAPAGSGTADGWEVTNLHRTLAQADQEPRLAPETLARLLSELSATGAAGLITPAVCGPDRGEVRFDFTPFDTGEARGGGPALSTAARIPDAVPVG
ncbi:hypothetical protein [Prauserella endophytica]|uniref:hypothetical protein n=1 Tax=Prauserella endophytica TaxID=1592324 RepID=UPI00197D1EE2|nr:hypothetical protein [Prauserella endophytica]